MTTSPAQPDSHLLALPFEVQHMILKEVYAGPYTLEAQRFRKGRISKDDTLAFSKPKNGHVLWTGGPPLAPLLLCRDLHIQALPYYRRSITGINTGHLDAYRALRDVQQQGGQWLLDGLKSIEIRVFTQGEVLRTNMLLEDILKFVPGLDTIYLAFYQQGYHRVPDDTLGRHFEAAHETEDFVMPGCILSVLRRAIDGCSRAYRPYDSIKHLDVQAVVYDDQHSVSQTTTYRQKLYYHILPCLHLWYAKLLERQDLNIVVPRAYRH